MSSSETELLFWQVAVNTFYISVWYDEDTSFTQMKQSNACEVTQSSSGDVVHVFMSSFSEAADVNITASVWVVKKKRASASYINRDRQNSYLNSPK